MKGHVGRISDESRLAACITKGLGERNTGGSDVGDMEFRKRSMNAPCPLMRLTKGIFGMVGQPRDSELERGNIGLGSCDRGPKTLIPKGRLIVCFGNIGELLVWNYDLAD